MGKKKKGGTNGKQRYEIDIRVWIKTNVNIFENLLICKPNKIEYLKKFK